MNIYNVILKVNGFIIPKSMKITTDLNAYWLYPDTYIHDLDVQILFNEKNIENRKRWSVGTFNKNKGRFSYIGMEMELDLSIETEELIKITQILLKNLFQICIYIRLSEHIFIRCRNLFL